MNSDSDILLKLREEEWALLRHYEDQRATVTNFILIVVSIAVGFLVQKGINRESLPITILLIGLGVYGVVAVAKLYERIHLANDLAISYTLRLEELYPQIGIAQLRNKARTKHNSEFRITSKLRMNYLWTTLHLAIVLAGIGLTIAVLR